MRKRLISSVVRGDYYVGEVNIICGKRGLLCAHNSPLLQQMILTSPT
jgi:hypothetical protein